MADVSIAGAQATGKLRLDGNGQLVKDAARWFGLMPFSNVIPGVCHSLTEASTLVTSTSYARVIESIERPWQCRGSVVSTPSAPAGRR